MPPTHAADAAHCQTPWHECACQAVASCMLPGDPDAECTRLTPACAHELAHAWLLPAGMGI